MEINLEQLDKIKIHFIVARPRTGSTLLSSMLNQHENILCIVEQPFVYFLFPKYSKIKKWDSDVIKDYCNDFFLFAKKNLELQFGPKEELAISLEQYKESLNYSRALRITYLCFFPTKNKSKISTIINKELIMGNYLDKMSRLFPESQFIFLYRNPLDNIARRIIQKQKKNQVNQDVSTVSIEWLYSYGMILHKKQKINIQRTIDVQYENLISDTEFELKRICEHILLPFSDQMLNYKDSKYSLQPNVKILELLHAGVTKELDKKKIGTWKESLTQKEADLIWKICGETAKKMGYQKDENISKTHLTFFYYLRFLNFIFFRRLIAKCWYNSPFIIKKFIKQKKSY